MGLIERIAEFGDLKKGWDSHKAEPIPEDVIKQSLCFANTVENSIEFKDAKVDPDPVGGVVFTFTRADGVEVNVQFLSGDYCYLLFSDVEKQFVVLKYPSKGVTRTVLAEFVAELMSVE